MTSTRSVTDVPAQAPAAAGPRHWRPDIQGLRAIAVTAVVLYHAKVPPFTGGYVGVDVFFVISGFLITGQLMRDATENGRVRFLRFYAGRIRRLLPAAALVTVVTVVAARCFMTVFQVRSVVQDAFATAYYGINYRLAAEGVDYQQAGGTPSPLQHFWSLAVEEQFYLVWPLLIGICALLARRRDARSASRLLPRLVLGVLLAVLAVSLWCSVTLTRSDPPMAYFAIHTRAWELAFGALLAVCVTRLGTLPRGVAAATSWVGVAGIVYSSVHYDDATAFPGTAALLPVAATALVIAAGSRRDVAPWSVERVLAVRPVQQVGDVSYAWYLWHWPILVLAPIAFGFEFGWVRNLPLVAVSLVLAALTRQLVERPTQRGRIRTRVWAGLGAAVVACTVGTALAVSASLPSLSTGTPRVDVGFADPSRLPAQLQDALAVMKVPAHLTPALAVAGKDLPASENDGCHAAYLVINQPDCVYGDPAGTHTIALIGDSHAQQWLPALDAEAKRLHWKLVSWTKAACPIADLALDNDSLHREYSECDSWRAITMSRVESLHPDDVVVAQSDNDPDTQVSNAVWADATAKATSTLTSAGLHVTYLLDTPLPQDDDAPGCLAGHLTDVTSCVRTRSGDSIYNYPGRHEAVAAALQQAKTATVDPVDWLCTATACPVVLGDILIYRDGSHLTATYSRYLAPMFGPVFVAE